MTTRLAGARLLVIVFHGDLDGVVGAALLARWASSRGVGARLIHSTVRGLRRRLRDAVYAARQGSPGGVAVVDIAVQGVADAIVYSQLLRGVPAAWFDHHPWPEGAEDRLRAAGVEVHHRRDRVSAQLVAEALGLSDEYSKRLVEMALADDTCRPGVGDADRWRIVLRFLDEGGLVRAAEALARGETWPSWADEILREKGRAYLERAEAVADRLRVHEVDGVRVATILMEPDVDVCTVQKILWRRGWRSDEVDVEVYIYPRAVSIRTTRLDASCIARRLGGGGHRYAAGAPLRLSYGEAQIARQVAYYAKMCMEKRG